MFDTPGLLQLRHIQNYSEASSLEPHWGYADRVLPCTNDVGSCAYLDVVYHAHDVGMLYSGILWAVVGSGLLSWALLAPSGLFKTAPSSRWARTISSKTRRYLLPEATQLRFVLGRVTRLQVLVILAVTAYLAVFSFAGITYATWVTPVKNAPGVYNTRTSLGPWADRVGLLAYALTPLSILLANRESLLSLFTGIPYHHFNFLHRWLGHIILAQASFHAIGWCIVEIRLYQPQPSVAKALFTESYIVWGLVALTLLLVLWGLSLPVSRRAFGYEFFRKSHYVLAMVYISACWAHWAKLKCFLLPALLLWFLDRGARLVRTGLIHYSVLPDVGGVFRTLEATVNVFDGDVVRLELEPYPLTWRIGQHFFLCFSDGGIWQSHPFTPLSLPGERQVYLFRARSGETKRIAQLATESNRTVTTTPTTTPVILTGPYGVDVVSSLPTDGNVLCIAGGTGITFVLPVLLALCTGWDQGGRVKLIWVVQHKHNTQWILPELERLRRHERIQITIHSTRDDSGTSPATPMPLYQGGPEVDCGSDTLVEEEKAQERDGSRRPDLRATVKSFVEGDGAGVASDTSTVFVSGPRGLTSAVRSEVAKCNKRNGEGQRVIVRLVHDQR